MRIIYFFFNFFFTITANIIDSKSAVGIQKNNAMIGESAQSQKEIRYGTTYIRGTKKNIWRDRISSIEASSWLVTCSKVVSVYRMPTKGKPRNVINKIMFFKVIISLLPPKTATTFCP
ncbi:MAG: hypothetical protein RR444_11065, partial [Oscillospiraceae bacterium]